MKKLSSILCMACALSSAGVLAEQWQEEEMVQPRYPIEAAKNSLEGCVSVQFFINSDGVPTYLEVLKSSHKDTFNKAAIKAIEQWRYSPTEANSERIPERQKTSLSFALSPNPSAVYDCEAALTAESSDIASFRANRLAAPIVATDLNTKNQSLERIFTVLSDGEKAHFVKSYSSLEAKRAASEQQDSYPSVIDGLTYHQVIQLAGLSSSQIKAQGAQHKAQSAEQSVEKLPLMSMPELINTWSIKEMVVGMDPELFKEISFRQLKAEVLLNSDGTAKLLGTCREVSEQMYAALASQVADWEISSKVPSPKPTRFIYMVPAPAEPGAYFDCDDAWNDKYQQSM
ncbi:energy transducer TonB [Pseudoalteromonas pernae]|uniref:energy transducer TonB n=1 Tax=Pseudoalteromonas pernae TaxID=3118054 RepID=UPI003242BBD5